MNVVAPDRGRRFVDAAARDADDALVALYTAHYRPLVRLAALLLRDTPAAQDVVQDAFCALHGSGRRLRETDKGLAFLRPAVADGPRARRRHRTVVAQHAPTP